MMPTATREAWRRELLQRNVVRDKSAAAEAWTCLLRPSFSGRALVADPERNSRDTETLARQTSKASALGQKDRMP
jgi:hypothetical protein